MTLCCIWSDTWYSPIVNELITPTTPDVCLYTEYIRTFKKIKASWTTNAWCLLFFEQDFLVRLPIFESQIQGPYATVTRCSIVIIYGAKVRWYWSRKRSLCAALNGGTSTRSLCVLDGSNRDILCVKIADRLADKPCPSHSVYFRVLHVSYRERLKWTWQATPHCPPECPTTGPVYESARMYTSKPPAFNIIHMARDNMDCIVQWNYWDTVGDSTLPAIVPHVTLRTLRYKLCGIPVFICTFGHESNTPLLSIYCC